MSIYMYVISGTEAPRMALLLVFVFLILVFLLRSFPGSASRFAYIYISAATPYQRA